MIRRLKSLLILAGYSDTDLSNVGSTEEHMIPTQLRMNDVYLTNVLVNVLTNVLVNNFQFLSNKNYSLGKHMDILL